MFSGGQLADGHRRAEPVIEEEDSAAMMHLCLSPLDEFHDEDPEVPSAYVIQSL